MAQLAKDKEALKERNKSLQEKNRSITKKHKGKFLISVFLCWSSRNTLLSSICGYLQSYIHAELKNLLEIKEDLVTHLKNLVYRHTDKMERFENMLKDADKQLAEALQQIKNMAEEKNLREKELGVLKAAA